MDERGGERAALAPGLDLHDRVAVGAARGTQAGQAGPSGGRGGGVAAPAGLVAVPVEGGGGVGGRAGGRVGEAVDQGQVVEAELVLAGPAFGTRDGEAVERIDPLEPVAGRLALACHER